MRWIRISGFAGFIFLALIILNFSWGIFHYSSSLTELNYPKIFMIPFSIAALALIIFFFGFYKIGHNTKYLLLSVSSLFLLFAIAASTIFSIYLTFFYKSDGMDLELLGPLLLFGLLLILSYIFMILFFSGLIQLGKEIKFFRISGILGIILFFVSAITNISVPFAFIIEPFKFLNIISYLLLFAFFGFLSFTLLDVSKKFEK